MDLSGDWDYITKIANERRQNNRTQWHIDENYLEVIGAAGELAARRLLGLPEELHKNFDGGVDLVWRGQRVDVKTTVLTPKLQYRYLQYPEFKPIRADIVLMFAVDYQHKYAISVGWAYRDEIERAPVNHTRRHPCKEISVRELRPVWQLFSDPVLND